MKHGLNQKGGTSGGKNKGGKHTAGDNANVSLWGKRVSPKGGGGKGGNKTSAENVTKC
jgi:hypothetical protein